MNNTRRKQIEAVKQRVAELMGLAEEIKTDLEQIKDDEQEYFDNMPENLQESEKGCQAEIAVNALEDAVSEIENLIGCGIEGYLDTATE